jgi:hypothetical protein
VQEEQQLVVRGADDGVRESVAVHVAKGERFE